MRLCAHVPDLRSCNQAGGGNYDWNAFNAGKWLDYCNDKMLLQQNEGILLVLGTDDGIELAALTVTPLDTWVYRLQQQELPTRISP